MVIVIVIVMVIVIVIVMVIVIVIVMVIVIVIVMVINKARDYVGSCFLELLSLILFLVSTMLVITSSISIASYSYL